MGILRGPPLQCRISAPTDTVGPYEKGVLTMMIPGLGGGGMGVALDFRNKILGKVFGGECEKLNLKKLYVSENPREPDSKRAG